MKKKIFLFIGMILVLTIILVFVFQRTKNSESLEDTSLRLKWICQAQFAGYYTVVFGDDENLYRLMLKKNGIDESSINEVPALTGVSQILTDKVDAKMAYEMNDAVLLELEGEEVNVLKFRDFGVKVYADTIFTTKEMIEKEPEKVRKFLRASIKGWKEAINYPEKAINQLLEVNPSLNYDHQLGYLIMSNYYSMNIAGVFVCIILSSLIGIGIYSIFDKLEKTQDMI